MLPRSPPRAAPPGQLPRRTHASTSTDATLTVLGEGGGPPGPFALDDYYPEDVEDAVDSSPEKDHYLSAAQVANAALGAAAQRRPVLGPRVRRERIRSQDARGVESVRAAR